MAPDRRKILLIIGAIAVLGLFLNLFPVRTGFHYWDETVYLQHTEIITGESPDNYNEFDFRPPMLPLLLSPVMALTGSLAPIHVFIAFIAAIGIPLTYLLGRELYGAREGVISALIYSLTPLVIKNSHDVLVDSILPLFWISAAFFLVRLENSSRKIYPVLAGVSIGLAVLSKFTSLVLIPAYLFIVLYRALKDSGPLDAVEEVLKSWKNWLAGVSFLFTVAPYMVWNYLSFGHPLHSIVKASTLTGSADSFLLYISSSWLLVPLPFILGFFGFKKFNRNDLEKLVLPAVFILVLYLPMQFMISNREIRYLTPLVPFLSVILGVGVSKIGGKKLVGILAVLSILMVPMTLPDRNITQGMVSDGWNPPVQDASKWLKDNISNDTVVYTNYRYPAIAYYSKKEIELIPYDSPLEDENLGPGIVYYSERSPYPGPDKARLESGLRFEHMESFDGKVRLYRYEPKNRSDPY